MRHIWGEMTYYRPRSRFFFGGTCPPVPRGIYALRGRLLCNVHIAETLFDTTLESVAVNYIDLLCVTTCVNLLMFCDTFVCVVSNV